MCLYTYKTCIHNNIYIYILCIYDIIYIKIYQNILNEHEWTLSMQQTNLGIPTRRNEDENLNSQESKLSQHYLSPKTVIKCLHGFTGRSWWQSQFISHVSAKHKTYFCRWIMRTEKYCSLWNHVPLVEARSNHKPSAKTDSLWTLPGWSTNMLILSDWYLPSRTLLWTLNHG